MDNVNTKFSYFSTRLHSAVLISGSRFRKSNCFVRIVERSVTDMTVNLFSYYLDTKLIYY